MRGRRGLRGLPARPGYYRFLLGFRTEAGFSAASMEYESQTTRIRMAYRQDTNGIRLTPTGANVATLPYCWVRAGLSALIPSGYDSLPARRAQRRNSAIPLRQSEALSSRVCSNVSNVTLNFDTNSKYLKPLGILTPMFSSLIIRALQKSLTT